MRTGKCSCATCPRPCRYRGASSSLSAISAVRTMPDSVRSAPRTLICGSLALDTIMVFPDRFARHILPGNAHVLSVAFQIGEMRREWGGCAGNIAYNLRCLGGEPVVMATVGDDGGAYVERLKAQKVATEGVRVIAGTYTAQAFIITDL